jgi:hypothetical protein
MSRTGCGNETGALGKDRLLSKQGEFVALPVPGHLPQDALATIRVAQDNRHDPTLGCFLPRLTSSPQRRQVPDAEGCRLLPDFLLLSAQRPFCPRAGDSTAFRLAGSPHRAVVFLHGLPRARLPGAALSQWSCHIAERSTVVTICQAAIAVTGAKSI